LAEDEHSQCVAGAGPQFEVLRLRETVGCGADLAVNAKRGQDIDGLIEIEASLRHVDLDANQVSLAR
jgi:hypothetical protein